LESAADVRLVTKKDITAFDLAILKGYLDCVKVLACHHMAEDAAGADVIQKALDLALEMADEGAGVHEHGAAYDYPAVARYLEQQASRRTNFVSRVLLCCFR